MSTPNLNSARERHWTCAQRLRQRRLALGLTQREVADRLCALGAMTTNRALSAMENGRGLDLGLLPELAVCLDCTVTYLLGMATDPAHWQPDEPGRQSQQDTLPGILGPDVPVRFVSRTHGRPTTEEARVP